jgi:hypothetical protein
MSRIFFKTHNYINRQNQSTTENCENRNDPDLVQAFLKKWWIESDFNGNVWSLILYDYQCHMVFITCTVPVWKLINEEKIYAFDNL